LTARLRNHGPGDEGRVKVLPTLGQNALLLDARAPASGKVHIAVVVGRAQSSAPVA